MIKQKKRTKAIDSVDGHTKMRGIENNINKEAKKQINKLRLIYFAIDFYFSSVKKDSSIGQLRPKLQSENDQKLSHLEEKRCKDREEVHQRLTRLMSLV